MSLKIHKPEGSENSPHYWTIIHSSGGYIAAPLKLVDEARAEQGRLIQAMVDAYNLAYSDDAKGCKFITSK